VKWWGELTEREIEMILLARDMRELTRAGAAERLCVSFPSAAALLEKLAKRRLVIPAGTDASSGGRKPVKFQFNPDAVQAVGIEIQPGIVRAVVCNLDATIRADWRGALPERVTPALLSAHTQRAKEAVFSSPGVFPERCVGTGLSLPGIVNVDTRVLEHAPNLFLHDIDAARIVPPGEAALFVENEANAAALAEYYRTKRAGSRHLVMLSVTRGVGAGIILGGKLHHGHNWRAGEFGHMAIREGTRPCNCGRSGCWEQYVSEKALRDDAISAGWDGTKDVIAALCEGGEPGKKVPGEVWQDYVAYLATGIENIVSCFDPDTIVIGGRIARMGERLLGPLRRELADAEFLTEGIEVEVSDLADNAPVIGAAILPLYHVYPASRGRS